MSTLKDQIRTLANNYDNDAKNASLFYQKQTSKIIANKLFGIVCYDSVVESINDLITELEITVQQLTELAEINSSNGDFILADFTRKELAIYNQLLTKLKSLV